jgi:hypothetical protein
MDYLFVPGNGRAENLGRQVLARRPNTAVITRPPAQNHLAGLLAGLAGLPPSQGNPTPRPIGDILLVAHGLETGEYFLRLSRRLESPADFERADQANAAHAVRLTAPLLTPAGGGPLETITVRLRGCNIGAARPFVAKLQEAMAPAGGAVNMTAPLHFDEFHDIQGGTLEYLAHKFTVKVNEQFRRPDGRSDRDALLAAFDAASLAFAYLDGTDIPAADWTLWVPKEIHTPRRSWKQSFDMDVDLSPPVGAQTRVTIHREYRYESIPFSWDWRPPDPGQHQRSARLRQPTADELDLLRNTLPLGQVPPSGRQLYDPGYAWPLHERYGFTDIDDYVDNLEWRVTFDGRTLHFRATRHEYTVMLPVTDPPVPANPPAPRNPPVLRFYNFFPSRQAPPAAFNLEETNAALYLIL